MARNNDQARTILQGAEIDLPVLESGELALCTDTSKVYMGIPNDEMMEVLTSVNQGSGGGSSSSDFYGGDVTDPNEQVTNFDGGEI